MALSDPNEVGEEIEEEGMAGSPLTVRNDVLESLEEVPEENHVAENGQVHLPSQQEEPQEKVEVIQNYKASRDDELTLKVGDIIQVLKKFEDSWWEGRLYGKTGLFPSTFTVPFSEEPLEEKTPPSSAKVYNSQPKYLEKIAPVEEQKPAPAVQANGYKESKQVIEQVSKNQAAPKKEEESNEDESEEDESDDDSDDEESSSSSSEEESDEVSEESNSVKSDPTPRNSSKPVKQPPPSLLKPPTTIVKKPPKETHSDPETTRKKGKGLNENLKQQPVKNSVRPLASLIPDARVALKEKTPKRWADPSSPPM
jgi:hypothetical protein